MEEQACPYCELAEIYVDLINKAESESEDELFEFYMG